MEAVNQIAASHHINIDLALTIIIALLIAALVIFIITKMIRAVITTLVLLFFIPVLFTVTFGDGEDMVHKASSFFAPSVEQRINESYDYFKQKENENPIVDVQQVTGTVHGFFDSNDKPAETTP